MAISKELRDWTTGMTPGLRRELWGPKGYPVWGTKFVEIEEQTGEVGDARRSGNKLDERVLRLRVIDLAGISCIVNVA
jgi:hypothetical protein